MDPAGTEHLCDCGYPLRSLPRVGGGGVVEASDKVRCPECGCVQVPRRVPRVPSILARSLLCVLPPIVVGFVLVLAMYAGMSGTAVLVLSMAGIVASIAAPVAVASGLPRDAINRSRILVSTLVVGLLANALIAGAFFLIGFSLAINGVWNP